MWKCRLIWCFLILVFSIGNLEYKAFGEEPLEEADTVAETQVEEEETEQEAEQGAEEAGDAGELTRQEQESDRIDYGTEVLDDEGILEEEFPMEMDKWEEEKPG